MIDDHVPIHNTLGRDISEREVFEAIQYLTRLEKHVTQESVARIVGCHPTVHKNFADIYKKIIQKERSE